MAEKRSPLQIRFDELKYQWKCRKRDQHFRKDYEDYKKGHLCETDICEKWGMDFVPNDLNESADPDDPYRNNPLGGIDIPVQVLDVIEGEAIVSLVESKVKFQATEGKEPNTFQITGRNELTTRHTFKVPANEKRVIVALNPRQPRLILEGIKLRPWEGRKKNAKADRAGRNLDLRIEVYDLFQEEGYSFPQIAAILKKSIATVWKAWLQAYTDIHRASPTHKKRQRRLKGFDPDTHSRDCNACRNAKNVKQMCLLAREFINQDFAARQSGKSFRENARMEEGQEEIEN